MEKNQLNQSSRPHGISAFVRCKNEAEYIHACLVSCHRVFDEIVVVLNNSTDETEKIVKALMEDYEKIKLFHYDHKCAPIGPGYIKLVKDNPEASLARYYNWCIAQTTFSHVCKWDGDMIALPALEQVGLNLNDFDVVLFDGVDPLDQPTTNYEPRIFRYDPQRALYQDWDLYEVLDHNYSKINRIEPKCYVHMKLLKKQWSNKKWQNPNDLATRSVPDLSPLNKSGQSTNWKTVVTKTRLRLKNKINKLKSKP